MFSIYNTKERELAEGINSVADPEAEGTKVVAKMGSE